MKIIPSVSVFNFFVIVPSCYHVLFVGTNGENDFLEYFEQEMFGYQTDYEIFFCFIFTNFLFISIIYLRSIFFELFVLYILMFFVQVSYKSISFTWWIIRIVSLIIGIIFVVYLLKNNGGVYLGLSFST